MFMRTRCFAEPLTLNLTITCKCLTPTLILTITLTFEALILSTHMLKCLHISVKNYFCSPQQTHTHTNTNTQLPSNLFILMKTRTGQVSFGYFPSHLDGYVFRSVIGKMWTPFSQVMGTLKAFSDA